MANQTLDLILPVVDTWPAASSDSPTAVRTVWRHSEVDIYLADGISSDDVSA